MDFSCPTCRQIDFVQSVPAICSQGVSTKYSTAIYSGTGLTAGGLVPVIGTATVERTQTSALAASLAREPEARPSGRLFLTASVLLLMALLMVVPAVDAYRTYEPTEPRAANSVSTLVGAALVPGIWAIPASLIAGAAVRRSLHNWRVLRGRRRADEIWRAGFYCHRCGHAYWPYSPAPGIPARQSLAPQQFRWCVWQASGFQKA